MQLITKETDYAIRALIHLAVSNSTYNSIRDISDKGEIPYQFLRRIFKKLKDENIVKTKEGKGGGAKLVKKPVEIKVLNVINIFQGEVQLTACMFRKNLCSNRKICVLRKKIKGIEKTVIKEFQRITIKSLIEDVGK